MAPGFILKSLSLRAVKKFDALELRFASGLNLLQGLNESGKSTVVLALRAVFLDRAKSVPVAQSLKPTHSSMAPDQASQIAVEFSFRGVEYQLTKCFAPVKSVRLDRQGQPAGAQPTLLDEAAEECVASLWHASLSERGVAAAKHQGLLGLLWVKQGDLEPVKWNEQAHAPLGAELTRRAQSSVSARELAVRIDAELAQFLGARGNPVKEFAKAEHEYQELLKQSELLRQQSEQLRADIESLDQLVQRHQDLLTQIGLNSSDQLDAERVRLRQWQGQWISAQGRYSEQKMVSHTADAALAQARKALVDWEKNNGTREQLQTERLVLAASIDEFALRLQADRTALDQLAAEVRTADAHSMQLARLREAARGRERQRALAAQLQRRTESEEELQRLLRAEQMLDGEANSRKQLRLQLKLVQQQLQSAGEQATQIRLHAAVDLSTTLSPRIAGRELPLNQDLLLSETTQIELSEGLRLEISPASARNSAQREKLEQLRANFLALLVSLQAAPYRALASAGPELRPTPECFAWLHRVEAQLEVDLQHGQELKQQIAAANARLQELESALAEVDPLEIESAWKSIHDQQARPDDPPRQRGLFDPPMEVEEISEVSAEQLTQAQRRTQQLRAQAELAHKHFERDQRDFFALQRDLAKIEGQLETVAIGKAVDVDELHGRIAATQREAEAQKQALQESAQLHFEQADGTRSAMDIEAAQAHLQARDSALAEAERLRKALADALQENRHQQEHQRGSISARFRQDLEVQLARTEAKLAQAARGLAQTRRKIAALQYLKRTLGRLQQERAGQVAAPLQEKLAPYLERLFGVPAQVEFDAQFVPVHLRRCLDGSWQNFAIEALSTGTREQLALLVRLAYADVLRDAGAASLLVFDDVLAYSDPQRQREFANVLLEAANRHQIVLLSCHPAHWAELANHPSVHQQSLP